MSKHKQDIIRAALELARSTPYTEIRRAHLVEATGYSAGTVSAAVGTMKQLERSLLRLAIQEEAVDILALGLARKHPAALAAPAELRERAAQLLRG